MKSLDLFDKVILAVVALVIALMLYGRLSHADCDKKACPYPSPTPTPTASPSQDDGGSDDEQDVEVAFNYTT